MSGPRPTAFDDARVVTVDVPVQVTGHMLVALTARAFELSRSAARRFIRFGALRYADPEREPTDPEWEVVTLEEGVPLGGGLLAMGRRPPRYCRLPRETLRITSAITRGEDYDEAKVLNVEAVSK